MLPAMSGKMQILSRHPESFIVLQKGNIVRRRYSLLDEMDLLGSNLVVQRAADILIAEYGYKQSKDYCKMNGINPVEIFDKTPDEVLDIFERSEQAKTS